jgi:hypothetical protein
MQFARITALVMLAACTSPPPPASPTAAAVPVPLPPGTPATGNDQLGSSCGDAQKCAAPAECVSYYGIAGPRGPEFKSCEVKCDETSACPDGTTCTTVADGPGRVCRHQEK